MKRLRLYADTSVFGGCFDDIFAESSRKLFDDVKRGKFILLLSETAVSELDNAPPEVRNVRDDLPPEFVEKLYLSEEVEELRDEYIRAGVVGPASLYDAEHIAIASVAKADVIVSWNFKHIVHFDKIRGYHAVNILQGYIAIPIHTPQEVVIK